MPSNAIATINTAAIAHESGYTEHQVRLIADQIMPGATPDELMLFATVSKSRGLDPFRRHIFAVSRRSQDDTGKWVDKWTYQVSIDGLRLIAVRSGRYEGQTPAEWCGPDGVWTEVWLSEEPPVAARVGVYIKGNRAPLYATALYRAFVQKKKDGTPTKFWADMPEHMLAKVAEAQALRKAFPEEAGGLYTSEELQRGQPVDGVVVDEDGIIVQDAAIPATSDRDAAKQKLWTLANKSFGWDQATLDAVAVEETGTHLREMDAAGLTRLYQVLVTEGEHDRRIRVDRALGIVDAQAS
jgi:phage recombination protein Bet